MRTKEVAVFGGSFDPPTVVHQQIVRTLLDDPSFDEVWVMPSGERRDKPHTTNLARRMAMLATMCSDQFADEPRLQVSDFEANLPQPTETCNTVRALERAHDDTRFWFVFGADSVGTMHTWREGERLLAELPMIVVPRHGYEIPSTARWVQELPDLDIFEQDISSTQVRQRVSEGRSLEGLVSGGIERFIHHRRLYREVAL